MGLSENNRRARFYAITREGRQHLHADASSWMRFARAVICVLEVEPSVAREEALARFGDPDKVARWLRAHDIRKLRRFKRTQAMSDLLHPGEVPADSRERPMSERVAPILGTIP